MSKGNSPDENEGTHISDVLFNEDVFHLLWHAWEGQSAVSVDCWVKRVNNEGYYLRKCHETMISYKKDSATY